MKLCQFLRKIKLNFLADVIIAAKLYADFLTQKIAYDGIKKTIGDALFVVGNNYRCMIRRIRLKIQQVELQEGILVAGPYVGELGFEICEWIPHLKSLADTYKCKVHVFTKNGNQALYPFADEFQTFDFLNSHTEKNWMLNPSVEEIKLYNELEMKARKYAKQLRKQGRCVIVEKCGYSRIETSFENKAAVMLEGSPELIEKWGKQFPKTNIILTCRSYRRGPSRNSNVDLINKLAAFVEARGWTPIVIGKTDEGISVPNVAGINLINQTSIADLIAIYKISSVVVGSSTGIMHLAAVCGTTHITWGSTRTDDTVIKRYNSTWNLNNTPVRFLTKGWNAEYDDITDALIECVQTTPPK
jgi:hypothetical protein